MPIFRAARHATQRIRWRCFCCRRAKSAQLASPSKGRDARPFRPPMDPKRGRGGKGRGPYGACAGLFYQSPSRPDDPVDERKGCRRSAEIGERATTWAVRMRCWGGMKRRKSPTGRRSFDPRHQSGSGIYLQGPPIGVKEKGRGEGGNPDRAPRAWNWRTVDPLICRAKAWMEEVTKEGSLPWVPAAVLG